MDLSVNLDFPPVSNANSVGLLAIGGNLSPGNMLMAYSKGIFPWYTEEDPLMWWSPDPRMILKPEDFKASKSLKSLVRKANYTMRIDSCFEKVMKNCAGISRKGEDGTWITKELTEVFLKLHQLGFAHSFEIFMQNELVGGLYGLAIGKVFFGESMFHKQSNASKLAFYHLVEFLKKNRFELIDAQQETPHLKSLGAYPVNRESFVKLLEKYIQNPSLIGIWGTSKTQFVQLSI
jgi:leucyl/phenylalanyl-tRNA--protein transferase